MQKLNKTVLECYNNTRRFLNTLNYEQIELLINALNENNCLQVTQTQIDSACDRADERIIQAQLQEEVENASK